MTAAAKSPTLFDAIKPPQAEVLRDAAWNPVYKCPTCGAMAALDDCDMIGADEDCLFCRACGKEFHQ
jgi:rubrerythrin